MKELARVIATGKRTRSTRREWGGKVMTWSTRAAAGKTMRERGVEEAMSTSLTETELSSDSEG